MRKLTKKPSTEINHHDFKADVKNENDSYLCRPAREIGYAQGS